MEIGCLQVRQFFPSDFTIAWRCCLYFVAFSCQTLDADTLHLVQSSRLQSACAVNGILGSFSKTASDQKMV